jgi:hypothetical protein
MEIQSFQSIASPVIPMFLFLTQFSIALPLIFLNLLPNRHPARLINNPALRPRSNPRHLLRILLVHTRAPLQQTLLDRTARLAVRNSRSQRRTRTTTGRRRDAPSAVRAICGRARVGDLLRKMRDGVWGRVCVAEASDERVVGFSRFGQGVVARVEVFALFQLALDQVFFGGEFAVEAEELLLFFGEGLEVVVLVEGSWVGVRVEGKDCS